MRVTYWSCSKFADWLRGISKPKSATHEEWDAWEENAKKSPVRYWLAEEGLDHLENLIYWPANRIHDLRWYISNRWITRTHALTSNLKRGSWYDFDTRLLYAAFDELVNFVEIEQAWMLVAFSEEDRKKYKTSWYQNFITPRLRRNPQAGLGYLKWAGELKNDFGQPTNQAQAAQETLMLYNWWKNERPKRLNPNEITCVAEDTAMLIRLIKVRQHLWV